MFRPPSIRSQTTAFRKKKRTFQIGYLNKTEQTTSSKRYLSFNTSTIIHLAARKAEMTGQNYIQEQESSMERGGKLSIFTLPFISL